MSDRVEQLFSQLRRGPWNADPLAVPQQGDGGIESQGWLSDGSVTADVIQANAVIAGKIDADAVTAREIAANTITAAEIAANTITAAQIAANTITAAQIAASTITTNEIAANTITAADIAAGTITAAQIAANTITANEIAADSITTSELAANAVIAENITAGEVTSGKLVLTITGKNFGANQGGVSNPGVFFDVDTDTGIYGYTGGMAFTINGAANFDMGGVNISHRILRPNLDNTHALGSPSFRWEVVYAATGTINTSDRNLKRDIADETLGIDFIQKLQPRVFRWRDTPDTQAREAVSLDGAAMAKECKPHERAIAKIRSEQRSGKITDAEADERVERERAAIDETTERHMAPVRAAEAKRRPGRRLHHGLVAQEVKDALDAAGVDSMNAGFWQVGPDGTQGLNYGEFTAILIRGMQEQQAAITEQGTVIADLTERLDALENR